MTINELIKELKITNITHAKLKDVCIFERGSYINQKEAESGDIPVISGGAIPIGFTNKFNRDYPCVSISSVGYAGENIYF